MNAGIELSKSRMENEKRGTLRVRGVVTRRMRIRARIEEGRQGCGVDDRSGSNLHAKTTSPSDGCDVEHDPRWWAFLSFASAHSAERRAQGMKFVACSIENNSIQRIFRLTDRKPKGSLRDPFRGTAPESI